MRDIGVVCRRGRVALTGIAAATVVLVAGSFGPAQAAGSLAAMVSKPQLSIDQTSYGAASFQVSVSSDDFFNLQVDYGTTIAYGTTCCGGYNQAGAYTISYSLTNLQPGTTYHIRAAARTGLGPNGPVTYGDDVSFTTKAAAAPQWTLVFAGNAPLSLPVSVGGGVYANGAETTARVDFGTTPALAQSSYPIVVQPDVWGQNTGVNIGLGDLLPGTTYYYHVALANAAGSTITDTKTFTTVPGQPTTTTTTTTVPRPPPPPKLPAPTPQKVQMDTVASASANNVIVGDTVKIHYTITNTGNIEPTQYDFNPRVTGPAALVSATPSVGQCAESNGMICKFGRLQPGVSVSLDLVLVATAPGPIALQGIWVAEPGASPLWAYFFSSGGDRALTAVARSADLAATLTITHARVRVGQRFTAQLRIADQGPDAMPAAAVRLGLPGVKLLAIQSAHAVCAVSKLRCTLGSLATGTAENLTLSLIATKPGSHKLTATLEPTGFTDPFSDNNQASAVLKVGRGRAASE